MNLKGFESHYFIDSSLSLRIGLCGRYFIGLIYEVIVFSLKSLFVHFCRATPVIVASQASGGRAAPARRGAHAQPRWARALPGSWSAPELPDSAISKILTVISKTDIDNQAYNTIFRKLISSAFPKWYYMLGYIFRFSR